MIENDETCTLAFRMAALEEALAERIEAWLPPETFLEGTDPWLRKQAAAAARIRAKELLGMATEYCQIQEMIEENEQAGSLQ